MVGSVSKEEEVDDDDDGNLRMKRPKLSGKIKLTFNAEQETEQSMEVDADAYMAELRMQVLTVLLYCILEVLDVASYSDHIY